VLHRALEQAVRFNMIPFNPASRVDPPKIRQDEITPLDAEQAQTFLEAAKGDRHECLYVLSLTCGLRTGEALGLKWSDIDLDAGTLRVNRQIQHMRRDADSGASGTLEFSELKNASRRTVDLPQRAVEALRSHRKRQLEEKRVQATHYEGSGLVFATGKGTPLVAQNVVNRSFKLLLPRSQAYLRDLATVQGHAPDLRTEVARALIGAANP
jgi:integrase